MDNYISIGQAVITQEQYEADKAYYDNSGLLNTVGTEPPSGTGVSLSDLGVQVSNAIAKVRNATVIYKFGRGTSTSNLLNDSPIYTDDFHLASWFVYNVGIIDGLTPDDVNDAKNFIINSNKLTQVNPSSTSSDSTAQKVSLVSNAQMGDLLLFDTFQRNGTVGIYTGNNSVLTVNDENGLTEGLFWTADEFGNNEYTGWLDQFNGTVFRIPRLNEDDYKWYVETSGISN